MDVTFSVSLNLFRKLNIQVVLPMCVPVVLSSVLKGFLRQ